MEKNVILTAGDWHSFSQLSNFNSAKEMDLAIRSWLFEFKRELSPTQEELVKLISQLAYKLKGVFAIKHETLATYMDTSVKTIQRSLRRLKDLGLLEVYETRTSIKQKTVKGKGNPKGRGHNVYVIKQVECIDFDAMKTPEQDVQSVDQSVVSGRSEDEKPVTSKVEPQKKNTDTKSFNTESSKDIKFFKTLVHETVSDKSDDHKLLMIPHWIPDNFAKIALNLFNAADEVKEAYTVTRRTLLKKFKYASLPESEVPVLAEKVIKSYYQQIKERQNKKTLKPIEEPFAYLTGIATNIADIELEALEESERQEIFKAMLEFENASTGFNTDNASSVPFYNWLEEN